MKNRLLENIVEAVIFGFVIYLLEVVGVPLLGIVFLSAIAILCLFFFTVNHKSRGNGRIQGSNLKVKQFPQKSFFDRLTVSIPVTNESDLLAKSAYAESRSEKMSGTPEAARIWESVLSGVRSTISKGNYDTWFRHTRGIKIDGGVFFVSVPSDLYREWLSSKYGQETLGFLRQQADEVEKIEYVVTSSKHNENQAAI